MGNRFLNRLVFWLIIMSKIKEIRVDNTRKPPQPTVEGKPIDISCLVCASTFFDIDDFRYLEPDEPITDVSTEACLFATKYGWGYYRVVASERLFADVGGLVPYDRFYVKFFKDNI